MSPKAKTPFHFFTRQNLTYLTARKARNARELLEGIRTVPAASIFHHTHHFLQQYEFLSPEPPNDFAYWLTNVLKDSVLGEKVAAIDLRQFHRLEDIRTRILEVMELQLGETGGAERSVPAGAEFNFMKAQTFVLPTKFVAHDLSEFRDCLFHVSANSIYYHMFESRLRLEREVSDFSIWLQESLNEGRLADAINRLDPYTQTVEGLRRRLARLISERLEGSNA
jgi:Family of unknown function (DUF5752)